VTTREFLRTHWWIAGLSCRGENAASTWCLPQVRQRFGEGVTVFLPSSGVPLSEAQTAEASDVLRQEMTVAERETRLTQLLGEQSGVLHVSSAADEILLYWPESSWPLWLLSPLRLPQRWDVATSMAARQSRLTRMAAAGGDLVLAVALAPEAIAARRTFEINLAAAITDGGPALLDVLEQRLRDSPARVSAVLLEVR
jgi:hypothetical protein